MLVSPTKLKRDMKHIQNVSEKVKKMIDSSPKASPAPIDSVDNFKSPSGGGEPVRKLFHDELSAEFQTLGMRSPNSKQGNSLSQGLAFSTSNKILKQTIVEFIISIENGAGMPSPIKSNSVSTQPHVDHPDGDSLSVVFRLSNKDSAVRRAFLARCQSGFYLGFDKIHCSNAYFLERKLLTSSAPNI